MNALGWPVLNPELIRDSISTVQLWDADRRQNKAGKDALVKSLMACSFVCFQPRPYYRKHPL